MAYEQRDMSGSLFKNDRKETEKHPDYNGSLTVDGREFWLSGWIRKSARGDKYLSLAVKPKIPKREEAPLPPIAEDLDDEIPFS